jgi:hypothetical protein
MSKQNLETFFSAKWINFENPDEDNLEDQAVDALQKDGIVYLIDDVEIHKWYYFCKTIEKKSIRGTVILETPLPAGWSKPNTIDLRLFRYTPWLASKKLGQLKQVPNQNLNKISKDFFALYGHWEWEKEVLVQSLERMGVLTNSVYSRPQYDRWLPWPEPYLDTNRAVTKHQKTVDPEGPTPKRFEHSVEKVHSIMAPAHTCHCTLVIENDVLAPNRTPLITEKFMYPIVMGMPWIYLGDPEKYETIKKWGFRAVEEPRSTVRGMVEQCLWYQKLFQDPEAVHRWRTAQQPIIERNLGALKRLPELLEKEWYDSERS